MPDPAPAEADAAPEPTSTNNQPVAPSPGAIDNEPVAPSPGAPTVTLARALELALEGNVGMLGTLDSLQAARLRESSARASFLPRLTPRYERSRTADAILLEGSQRLPWTGGSITAAAGVRSFDEDSALAPVGRTSDVRVTLSQPLLRGFGPTAASYDLVNSRRGRQAQERNLQLERQRLAVRVAQEFYNVLQQRELVAVAQQSQRRSEALERASEARLAVGLVSKLDVFRAQLQASQAQESAIRSEAGLEGALERFRVLLGLAPTDTVEPEALRLPDAIDEELEPTPVLVQRALANRLDLQEARDTIQDARRTTALARQGLWPQIDLNVGLNRIGSGATFGNSLSVADQRVTVFLSTSYPLERATDRAGHQLAKLDEAARARNVLQREREVESEVRAAVRELVRIRQSVTLQRQALTVAEQQQRLATLRYQRGLASNFDVVDAEGSLLLARNALVGLLASYQVARVELLRVTGTLDVEREFDS